MMGDNNVSIASLTFRNYATVPPFPLQPKVGRVQGSQNFFSYVPILLATAWAWSFANFAGSMVGVG